MDLPEAGMGRIDPNPFHLYLRVGADREG